MTLKNDNFAAEAMIRRCKDALGPFIASLHPNAFITVDFGTSDDNFVEKKAKADDAFAKKYIDDNYVPLKRDVTKLGNVPIDYAMRLFKEFIHEIEIRINGKCFYRLPPEKRIQGAAFPEHIHKNIHFHIVAQIPQSKVLKFLNYAPTVWKKTVKRGSIKTRFVNNLAAEERAAKYSVKESFIPENYEQFFFIEDFWRKK
jgi:hypothetical protein